MSDLTFADLALWKILLPLFLLWALLWAWLALRKRSGSVRFSNIRILKRLKTSRTLWVRRLVMALRLVTVALLMVAAIRPQTGRSHREVRTEGIDIVLVVDTSGSMQALDLDAERQISRRRNRLAVVQGVVEEFITKRPNDQIGLVVFGAEAFTQCPLTLDHGIVSSFLDQLEIGMAGDATAIGSAVGTAVKRLKDSEAKSKVMILLTDGRNNAGALSPAKAAEIAQTFGIKVYAIGAGSRGQAPFIVKTPFGKEVIYQDVEIDEDSLREIAEVTGGAYFRAEDEEALGEIYEQIDELETTEITTDTYMEYDERFHWFAFPALALLLLEVLLLGTRLRKLP